MCKTRCYLVQLQGKQQTVLITTLLLNSKHALFNVAVDKAHFIPPNVIKMNTNAKQKYFKQRTHLYLMQSCFQKFQPFIIYHNRNSLKHKNAFSLRKKKTSKFKHLREH